MIKRNKICINVGDKFGFLEVTHIEYVGNRKRAFCNCECGNTVDVAIYNLKTGGTKSCGCFHKRVLSDNKTTHGLSKCKIYATFQNIVKRTNDPQYKDYSYYGGRGIKCEWENVEDFIRDMLPTFKEGLSIDRIDNDGNYSKENCRWATKSLQSRNRRSNIIYEGKCILDWCSELGLNHKTIYTRINILGWDIKDAIFTPTRKIRSNKNFIQ